MMARTYPEHSQHQATVLVVDDLPDTWTLCQSVLERAGYRVLQARSSEEALHVARCYTDPIAVLLVDFMLPHIFSPELLDREESVLLNGNKLIDELTTLTPSSQPVLMSAYSDRALNNLGLKRRGNCLFLQKPFTSGRLLEVIGDAVREAKKGSDHN